MLRGLKSACAVMATAGMINHFSCKGDAIPRTEYISYTRCFPSRMMLVAVKGNVQLDGFLKRAPLWRAVTQSDRLELLAVVSLLVLL